MRRSPSSQCGAALVTALLLVAVAAIVATAMGVRLQVDLRRTTSMAEFDQARTHAVSAERFALELLHQLRRRDPESHPFREGCDSPPLSFPLGGSTVAVHASDLHCRFNLNDLDGPDAEAARVAFIRLLETVNRELAQDRIDPDLVARATSDWLSTDTDDPFYQGLAPPYRSANRPMLTADELMLVRGMNARALDALRPYITALPERGMAINREGAPEPVQRATQGLDREMPEAPRYMRVAITVSGTGRDTQLCSIMDTERPRIVYRHYGRCP